MVGSLIVAQGLMLLMPRMLSWIIVPPYTQPLVHDSDRTALVAELESSSQFQVRQAGSMDELKEIIGSSGSGLGVQVALEIPAGVDKVLASGNELVLDGYVAWGNRTRAPELEVDLEGKLADVVGQPVAVEIEGNIVYPPQREPGLLLGLSTLTVVTVMLIMGIQVVPTLMIEEKQAKTMDALLVSPASVGEVVVGKALAGLFYILVAACIVLFLNRTGVVH